MNALAFGAKLAGLALLAGTLIAVARLDTTRKNKTMTSAIVVDSKDRLAPGLARTDHAPAHPAHVAYASFGAG